MIKKILFTGCFCWLLFLGAQGQTYNMANGTVNTCAGNFYDAGGVGGNYANNSNLTQTFCSGVVGSCVRLTFTAFNTQAGNDVVTFYDGPNNTFPIIGVFSGNITPPIVTASSGCITVNFVSNNTTVRAGWAATITCVPCATNFNLNNNTPVTACATMNFYDSGGPSANYSGNENFTKTFCSGVAGQCLQVEFNTFATQAGNDQLSVYDGNSVAAPLFGTWSGGTVPPVLLSSTGCLTFRWVSNNSNHQAGWNATITCVACPPTPAPVATYTSPTSGLQNTYVGANMVNTCGPATFTDDGGTAANYSNNLNDYYRTFCPNQAGRCMRAIFQSFSMEPAGVFIYDYLTILNGPTQTSPEFGVSSTWYGTANTYQACQAAGLGPYVSTDQSGCLTFRAGSDGSVNLPGWVATLDCVPCSYGPNGTDNNDCQRSSAVCNDIGFSDASTGPGIISEGGSGCVVAENYTNWYNIIIQSSGNLGLIIRPSNVLDDYDFALYGPNTSCGGLGTPLRCSFAADTNWTGLNDALNLSFNSAICGPANNGADVNEDVCGNGYTNTVNVLAGERYRLMVNKWTAGGSGFTLDWVLTGGASLNCIVLPITLIHFDAKNLTDKVELNWATASEFENDFFTIERSSDGLNFNPIEFIEGAGTTHTTHHYHTFDQQPLAGQSYYRLKQTDINGMYTYSETVSINRHQKMDELVVYPNPATEDLNLHFNVAYPQQVRCNITSTDGKQIQLLTTALEEGNQQLRLPLQFLESGLYFLTLELNNQTIIKRFVKQ